jgi:hypothetical protein
MYKNKVLGMYENKLSRRVFEEVKDGWKETSCRTS